MKKPQNKNLNRDKAGAKTKKNQLSDEDLWADFSSKITPLSEFERNLNIRSMPTPYSEPAQRLSIKQGNSAPVTVAPKTLRPVKPFEHGKADGLDRISQKKMRRGRIEIEARLDLHGMVQTEAHSCLVGFMERAYQSGKRSVLVITGKGLTRHGDIGVLRKAVPKWLNEAPMKSWIRGFDYAAPSDGGEGALYILLRRKR